MITNIKFSNLFSRSSATRTDSTRTASANQAGNTAPQTSSSAALPVPSASDRDVSERKSKKERSGFLTLLHRGKNNRAESKTALADGKWHVQFPWITQDGNITLNAKIFEESILNSIQMDASNNRNWATRTKDMGNVLAKLKMLSPDQFDHLSVKGKATVLDIFRHILRDIRKQQSLIGEIFREKEAASSSSKILKRNPISAEMKKAKKALDAIGKQVERLFPILIKAESITERLREQARHMRELDSSHEEIEKSNEKEYLEDLQNTFGRKKKERAPAKVASKAISQAISAVLERSDLAEQIRTKIQNALKNAKPDELQSLDAEESAIPEEKLKSQNAERTEASSFTALYREADMAGIDLVDELSAAEIAFLSSEMAMEKKKSNSNSSSVDEKKDIRTEIQDAEKAEIEKLQLSAKQEGNNWGQKLAAQNKERTEVSNQIIDLFNEAAREGIDLSNELKSDEIDYLTRAMGGGAIGSIEERGLVTGGLKHVSWPSDDGKIKEITVKEVTKQETDKLARQTADLLHERQLQDLLSRLNKQETHLDQLKPGSTEALSEGAINIDDALKRINKLEIDRLCNHNEVKGPKAKSHIYEQLDRIREKAKTLEKDIRSTLDKSKTSTNSLTNEGKRQLEQAEKFLKTAQDKVDTLQGKGKKIQAAAPSTQR